MGLIRKIMNEDRVKCHRYVVAFMIVVTNVIFSFSLTEFIKKRLK